MGIVTIIFILWILTAKDKEQRGRRLRSPFALIMYVVLSVPLLIGACSLMLPNGGGVSEPEGETPVPTQSSAESAYRKRVVASVGYEGMDVVGEQIEAFNEDPTVINSLVWRKRIGDAIDDVRAANKNILSLTPPPGYEQIDKQLKLAAAEYDAALDYLSTWVDKRGDFPREASTHFDVGYAAHERFFALWQAKLGTPQPTAVSPPPLAPPR